MVELTVDGKAFLWHQIRCVVAILLLVGQHKESPSVSTIAVKTTSTDCLICANFQIEDLPAI